MPLTPTEIMLAKIWANGLVIVVTAAVSLRLVVQRWLGLPIAGSMVLFVAGVVVYLFAIASLSLFLATLARSMPQFALLAFPLFIIMNLLSGGNTPLDSMPQFLQMVMQGSPSTHFVSVAQAILYHGAGFDVVWRVLRPRPLVPCASSVPCCVFAKHSPRCSSDAYSRAWPCPPGAVASPAALVKVVSSLL